MVVCPITSKAKGYPLEVALPAGLAVSGVILADQVKNIDWRSRNATYACEVEEEVMTQVLKKLTKLLKAKNK
jgi:mRNA interferase MazF